TSHHWTQAFGRDHHDIHIFWWEDCSIVNGKAMGEEQRLSGPQIWSDVLFVDLGNFGVGHRQKNNVSPLHRFGSIENFKSASLRLRPRFAFRIKTNDNGHPTVTQI